MAPAPRITVVGGVNLDLVAVTERLPRPGETVSGATFSRAPGGKGANQALAAARLGAQVSLIARVGQDAFADEALELLRSGGVALEAVSADQHTPTGVAMVVVGEGGENQIVVASGANASLLAEDVRLEAADAVLCQLEIPDEPLVAAADQVNGLLCLNAAPGRPVPGAVLERADLLIVNELEAELLRETLIAFDGLWAETLGPRGAVLRHRDEILARAEPPAIRAVDTTGAGDAFCAALLVGLLEERGHEEALGRACAAGALAATRPQAQPSLPTAEEVDAILLA